MDRARLLLTGALPMMLIVACATAFPVSLALVAMYRRAVRAAMRSRSAQQSPTPSIDAEPTPPSATGDPGPLVMRVLDRQTDNRSTPLVAEMFRARWLTAAVYVVAGAAFALVMTIGFLEASGEDLTTSRRVATLFWIYFWPTILAINLVTSIHTPARAVVVAAYFVVLALWALTIRGESDTGVGALLVLWLILVGPATLMLAAFMTRRLRAVGPLVLACLGAAWTGAFATLAVFQQLSDPALRALVTYGEPLGLGAGIDLVRRPSPWLRRLHAAWLAHPHLAGATVRAIRDLGRVAADWRHRAPVRRGRLDQPGAERGTVDPRRLCRVRRLVDVRAPGLLAHSRTASATASQFAAAARLRARFTQRAILRRLAARLAATRRYRDDRRTGLAAANLEPHEFLQFVRGRVRSQFIVDEQDLDARATTIEDRVTPDGRHRVHEFFCFDNTWRPTLNRLVKRSDLVIMDLRAFSAKRQGCAWELTQLFETILLDRVALVIDDTTDQPLLEETLRKSWAHTSPLSPNRQKAGGAAVTLFKCRGAAEQDLRPLLASLFEGARSAA